VPTIGLLGSDFAMHCGGFVAVDAVKGGVCAGRSLYPLQHSQRPHIVRFAGCMATGLPPRRGALRGSVWLRDAVGFNNLTLGDNSGGDAWHRGSRVPLR
jgi:hypothetical protein